MPARAPARRPKPWPNPWPAMWQQRQCARASTSRILFPGLDRELGLSLALAVGDLELEILRADALLELEIGAALVVALIGALAVEDRHELVLADLEVA